MRSRNVVVLADTSNRGQAFAEVVEAVACCRVSGPTEAWTDLVDLDGVIADVSLSHPDAQNCLKKLSDRLAGRPMPLIYLARSDGPNEFERAAAYGATGWCSAFARPRGVLTGLLAQIAPNATMTDLLVEHSVGRFEVCVSPIPSDDRPVLRDPSGSRSELDSVVSAFRDPAVRQWMDRIRSYDQTTARHCVLVASLVANFATHLAIPGPTKWSLVRAALLHDVGKTEIPLSILNKPGPLDPDEFTIMRTHAARGHAMLVDAREADPITLMVARHHHEMLDGSGYPDKLTGTQVTEIVRILSICDVYAALVERRPYRPAVPQPAALSILKSMTSTKLDPILVEEFAASLDEGPISGS